VASNYHGITDCQRESAKGTFRVLAKLFENFLPSEEARGCHVILVRSVLFQAYISYVLDLDRHAQFHNLKLAAEHKHAAFIFKWISRLRPVQPKDTGRMEPLGCELEANGRFALACALLKLDATCDAIPPTEGFPAEGYLAKHLIYASTYRDIEPTSWAMIFAMLNKAQM
jgi:hypothetical protein